MPYPDPDHIEPMYDVVTLTALKFVAREMVSPYVLETMRLDVARDEITRGLVFTLRAHVYGRQAGRQTAKGSASAEFRSPANWREHWKIAHHNNWYGRILLRWFPLKPLRLETRTARYTFEAEKWLTWPDAQMPAAMGDVVRIPIFHPPVWSPFDDPVSTYRPTTPGKLDRDRP